MRCPISSASKLSWGSSIIQAVLNDPILDVRWLSHERAVQNLRQCFPFVLASLEREASERHDAQALCTPGFGVLRRCSFFCVDLAWNYPIANVTYLWLDYQKWKHQL